MNFPKPKFSGLSASRFFLARVLLAALALLAESETQAVSLAREQDVLSRFVVFPIQSDEDLGAYAEDAYFQVRREILRGQRFMLSSKQFLIKEKVFQPRSELRSQDVVILSHLLDAQVLVVLFVRQRSLNLIAYEAEGTQRLWQGEFKLHPSIPIEPQLGEAARKLTLDFLSSFPYQGHVLQDEIENSAVIDEKGKKVVRVMVGLDLKTAVGDPVQFIRLKRKSLEPLFADGAEVRVFGEGTVLRQDRDNVWVELTRMSAGDQISAFTLVRFPQEFQRLRKQMALFNQSPQLNPTEVAQNSQTLKPERDGDKPTLTTLAFISSIAAFLLLAL